MVVFLLQLLMLPVLHASTVQERLVTETERLLGVRYVVDPFGEGEGAKYDRDPVQRFDAFDCTTFVETAMALALSRDSESFQRLLMQIRYKNGEVGYTTRNHFPETDWIPNNERAGFVRDITREVAAYNGVQMARALIDKRAWYEHKRIEDLSVPGASSAERQRLLAELRAEGREFGRELSELPYITLDSLFPAGSANTALFDRIPSGSIINIVRPNWDLTPTQGTHLNISHQGIVFRRGGGLYIRHATNGAYFRVIDLPLVDYLKGLLHHPTIRGIHLLSLVGGNH